VQADNIQDAVRMWADKAVLEDITAALFDPLTVASIQKIMWKEIKRRMIMPGKNQQQR
jgi:hypothetical protein